MTHPIYLIKSNDIQTAQRGVTLIELMVALVIGLVVSLAIYGVFNASEGRKRTTNSTNDIDQSGSYAIYQFGKIVRSAGSGFSGAVSSQFSPVGSSIGCPLNAAKSGTTVLPAGAAFPAPFAAIPLALRLVPVIIFPNAAITGDVLLTMAGSGGLAEAVTDFSAVPTTSNLRVTTLAPFRKNDMLLIIDSAAGAGISNCLVEQVSNSFTPAVTSVDLPLAGNYYTAGIGSLNLTNYSASGLTSSVLNLGASPIFSMFGVGANNTLMRYDLLNPPNSDITAADANPSVFSDSVYAMYALYGVDNDNNPNTTTLNWIRPTTNAADTYAPVNLLAGTVAANALLQTIKAVKVGLIMQSSLIEKIPAGQSGVASPGLTYTSSSAASMTLFTDTLAATQITQAVSPFTVRYRIFEITIPIRNSLVLTN